mmetsp:Transcript_5307/g.11525  ORF Transcript_5307/g.11525 Transcript_5307/m.11525 type:complete len:465 (+) Transcript_5307:1595-2989(+)
MLQPRDMALHRLEPLGGGGVRALLRFDGASQLGTRLLVRAQLLLGVRQRRLALLLQRRVHRVGEGALRPPRHGRSADERLVAVTRLAGREGERRREDLDSGAALAREQLLELLNVGDRLVVAEQKRLDAHKLAQAAQHLVARVVGDGERLVKPRLDAQMRQLGRARPVGRRCEAAVELVDVHAQVVLLAVLVELVAGLVIPCKEGRGVLFGDGLLGELRVQRVWDVEVHQDGAQKVVLWVESCAVGPVGETRRVGRIARDQLLLAPRDVAKGTHTLLCVAQLPFELPGGGVVVVAVVASGVERQTRRLDVLLRHRQRLGRRGAQLRLSCTLALRQGALRVGEVGLEGLEVVETFTIVLVDPQQRQPRLLDVALRLVDATLVAAKRCLLCVKPVVLDVRLRFRVLAPLQRLLKGAQLLLPLRLLAILRCELVLLLPVVGVDFFELGGSGLVGEPKLLRTKQLHPR